MFNLVLVLRLLKGRCHGNQFTLQIDEISEKAFLLGIVSIQQQMAGWQRDGRVATCDVLSTFGALTPEFTALIWQPF